MSKPGRLLLGLWMAAVLGCLASAWGAPPAPPPDVFDAHPQEDDLVLPMPGNARMVFRPVWLGIGDRPLATRDFMLGDREKKSYKETVVPVKLGGSFVKENHGQRDALYYLGKYEVTRAQFASMPFSSETGAQTAAAGPADLPQTDLTAAQVARFVSDYDVWLHANQLAALPAYEGNVGIVRLPNEVEWEFAARGGVATVADAEHFDARTPYGADLGRYEWFAGPRSSVNKLKPVGRLRPNPLGIYDLLGNAAELTSDAYRLQYGQGVQGGLTVRGGSFRTEEGEMRSSLRTEQPVYGRDSKPPHDDSIGFRLVVTASQVFTDQNRSLVEAAAREQKPAPSVPPVAAPSGPVTLPADARSVDDELIRRQVALDNEQKALRVGGGQTVSKGSRVWMARDEKMYFNEAFRRTGQVGEVFTVAFHDTAKKKVFVLVADPTSTVPMALSVVEDALEIVPRDAEAIFREALDDLQARDFRQALPLLGQLAQGNQTESMYGAVNLAVVSLVQAIQAADDAPRRQQALLDQAAVKRRNATTSRQGNQLSGVSARSAQDARDADAAAAKLEQEAKNLVKQADQTLREVTNVIHDTAQKLDKGGAPDVALALCRCLRVPDPSVSSGERAARADLVYAAAQTADHTRHLYQCRTLIKSGLEAAPLHRSLRHLAPVVEADISLVERGVHTAEALEQKGQPAAAALIARHAAALCKDSDALNGMSSRLVASSAP